MATVLTSIDAATILASGVVEVPTGSGSIPTAGPPAIEVPTGSDVVPTASLVFATASPVFATATVVTPYIRRKGKEIMVEYETQKKKKVQEQIDAQVARDLEEQLAREDQRMSEQAARDAEIVRIHAEEELQSMIDGLDRSNETTQQRRPWSKKQKRDYYMAVIKSNLSWKLKDFKGMTFEKIEAKFTTFWKQLKDFIPMGSKEEAERLKRKGLSLEQQNVKKLKTSEEVTEESKSPDEVPEEKVKEMMQLVPIEEVYVKALQVKHHIIDWKHMDREDLNQLWALVKESLSNRHPTSDKEMELWLYDMCGVHQVTSKDKEIFMLVEKDYPLRKGLALVMICYKLQVENYSQMANDPILRIYKIANCPSQQVIEFPLAEEVPTASEESCHCQKKREATAVKISLLSKSRRNCQSKSNDCYAKVSNQFTTLYALESPRRGLSCHYSPFQEKKSSLRPSIATSRSTHIYCRRSLLHFFTFNLRTNYLSFHPP
nr:hypothetical protein [Tanacetum cinerariifolium]